MRLLTAIVGLSALFLAVCAAVFSVRGIGLLFAGSMIPVIIMATSLEVGKLVAASVLKSKWDILNKGIKAYMFVSLFVLMGITSLGIYGYLSDAFEETKTRITVYEDNITQLGKEILYMEQEIDKIENSATNTDDKAKESIDQYKKLYDEFVVRNEARKNSLKERVGSLDEAVAVIESKPGGLFSSKKTQLEKIKAEQAEERASIKSQIRDIEDAIEKEYQAFLTKVERLRGATEQVDTSEDVEKLYSKIKSNNTEIFELKTKISATDIGSFKFIARAFNQDLDTVVKWFIIVIVVVFDPMAISLVVAFNACLAEDMRIKGTLVKKKEPEIEEETDDKDDTTEESDKTEEGIKEQINEALGTVFDKLSDSDVDRVVKACRKRQFGAVQEVLSNFIKKNTDIK
jgi:hypothetical protein